MKNGLGMRAVVALAMASCAALSGADAEAMLLVGKGESAVAREGSRVLLVREGNRTVLTLGARFSGGAGGIAVVLPVPAGTPAEAVSVVGGEVFSRLDGVVAPRLVEYWEQNPCEFHQPGMDDGIPEPRATQAAKKLVPPPKSTDAPGGPYTVTVLSREDARKVADMLKSDGYALGEAAEQALAAYVSPSTTFLIAKLEAKDVAREGDLGALPPLRVAFDSPKLSIPLRLLGVGATERHELVLDVLAPEHRYEALNWTNVAAPTNVDVKAAVKSNTDAFYGLMLNEVFGKWPDAVVTEYAWRASSCASCTAPALEGSELPALGTGALPSADKGVQHEVMIQVEGGIAKRPDGPAALRGALMECYGKALAEQPGAEGKVALDVTVGAGGKVEKATVGEKASPELTACAESAVSATSFDGAAKKGKVAVSFLPLSRKFVADFIMTRMRMRLGAPPGKDLLLREGVPVEGGREMGPDGKTRGGVYPAARFNNYQARYPVRHEWAGKTDCAGGQRHVWGPPPEGVQPKPGTVVKGFAGEQALTDLVSGELPDLETFTLQFPPAATKPATSAAEPPPAPSAAPPPTPAAAPAPPEEGCGNATVALIAVALAGLWWGLTRRRRDDEPSPGARAAGDPADADGDDEKAAPDEPADADDDDEEDAADEPADADDDDEKDGADEPADADDDDEEDAADEPADADDDDEKDGGDEPAGADDDDEATAHDEAAATEAVGAEDDDPDATSAGAGKGAPPAGTTAEVPEPGEPASPKRTPKRGR